MKRSRKLKSVSWPKGDDLCQVKLFLSEDSPSKVGFKSPDNLQPRGSSFLHPNSLMHNNCPPGFEFNRAMNSIPLVRWKCPPKLLVTGNWLVAAGEESEDAKIQKQREATVLESIYPRFSDIPPSPSVSLDVNSESHNDNLTPIVPMIPIEEETSADLPALPLSCSNPLSMASKQSLPKVPKNPSTYSHSEVKSVVSSLAGVDADVAAAAAAALAVLMKSNEQGSLIDTNYLITILSDSNMIEKLIAYGGQTKGINSMGPNAHVVPSSSPATLAPSIPVSETNEQSGNFYQSYKTELTASGNAPLFDTIPGHQVTIRAQSAPSPSPFHEGTSKDINYYKNLIREHGEQGNQHPRNHGREIKMGQAIKDGTVKPKNQKPCMYFNSLKGCRNGARCPFKHELSHKWQSGKLTETTLSSKRMKLGHTIPRMMI